MDTIKVVIADDHAVIRKGINLFVDQVDDIDIVGTGTHHRFLADATKSADRLRKKAEKVGL